MSNYLRSDLNDTICALATPEGIGAIGVIRISGSNAINIVNHVFKGKNLASLAKCEATAIGTNAITSGIRNNGGRFFPTPKSPSTN